MKNDNQICKQLESNSNSAVTVATARWQERSYGISSDIYRKEIKIIYYTELI
jgi:hypothetical protein